MPARRSVALYPREAAFVIAAIALAISSGMTARAEAADTEVAAATAKPAAKVLPKVTLEVKALALSTIPEPRAIAPYVESLSCNLWEVTKVVSSEAAWPADASHRIAVGQKIHVLQWGIQKAKKTALADAKTGDARTITVQDPEDTPQFEEINRSCSIDWDADLVTFYEPTLAAAPAASTAAPAAAKAAESAAPDAK